MPWQVDADTIEPGAVDASLLWQDSQDVDDDRAEHGSRLLQVLDEMQDDMQLEAVEHEEGQEARVAKPRPSSQQRLASALARSNASMRLTDAMAAAGVASASWAKMHASPPLRTQQRFKNPV